jgi:SAM-dependent methyltransferase
LECWLASELRHLRGGKTVFDLRCGTGLLLSHVCAKVDALGIGVDIAAAPRGRSNVNLARADFASLPLRAGSMDAAYSLDALYLADEPVAALTEVRRVLRRGAGLFFTVYTACGPVPGLRSLCADWRPMLREAGFRRWRVRDWSREWRTLTARKHVLRLQHGRRLLRLAGSSARRELAVSRSVLRSKPSSCLQSVRRAEIEAYA